MIRLRRHLAQMNPVRATRVGLRRLRSTETGQSLVEFAMVLPLFLVLLFGLVDFGRAFYSWMLITNAAREGARTGAVQKDWASMKTAAYDSMCNPYPGNCSLDTTKMVLASSGVQGARGGQVSVDITYAFTYATPLGNIIALLPGGGSLATPVLKAHSAMRLE
ncbi:MAG: TadE family protein [Anaerolineaceae bacterium]